MVMAERGHQMVRVRQVVRLNGLLSWIRVRDEVEFVLRVRCRCIGGRIGSVVVKRIQKWTYHRIIGQVRIAGQRAVQHGRLAEQRVRQVHVCRLIHNVLKLAGAAQIVHDRAAGQLMQLSKLPFLLGVRELHDDAGRGALCD